MNYFGSVALVRGLQPQLAAAGGAAVVLMASNSITAQPGWASEVTTACLEGDEAAAREHAAATEAVHVYPATKAALAYWARREGVKDDWIGSGIRVNAVAPGLIATPMTDKLREDPQLGVFADAYPSALGRPGRPRRSPRPSASCSPTPPACSSAASSTSTAAPTPSCTRSTPRGWTSTRSSSACSTRSPASPPR